MTFKAWRRKYAREKTLREIAAESKLSLGSVFNALNGARVSQRTMQRLVSYTGGLVSYESLVRVGARSEARA